MNVSMADKYSERFDRSESPHSVDRERDREEKLKAIGLRNARSDQENKFGLASSYASLQSQGFQPPSNVEIKDDIPSRAYMMTMDDDDRGSRKSNYLYLSKTIHHSLSLSTF